MLQPQQLLIATHNKHKLEEIRPLIPAGFKLISLDDVHFFDEIEETALTLEGNAMLKAEQLYEKFSIDCFADDTGLEVKSLKGQPGVFSARYAGPGHDFEKNIDKLLSELEPFSDRQARFRTVICLFFKSSVYYFEGIVNGQIIRHRHGNSGFGYDPVFIPDGKTRTFAEMAMKEKNEISHRAIAVQKMIDFLRERSLTKADF